MQYIEKTFRVCNKTWASTELNSLHNFGCYILRQRNQDTLRHIPRLGGIDKTGVLYLGMSVDMKKRVNSLMQSTFYNHDPNQLSCIVKGHKTFSKKFYRARNQIDFEALEIKTLSTPLNSASIMESYLLEKYVAQYAELPPLNGQYGSFAFSTDFSEMANIFDIEVLNRFLEE